MDQELRNLKKNTVVIAIANIGSKGISFILAPLYSFIMSTAEYGIIDILSTAISLLFPILCFDIYEATFRYSSDNKYNDKKVLNTSLRVCGPACVLSILISVASFAIAPNNYYVAVPVCVFLSSINCIFAQYLRGKQRIKQFAFSGVVSAVSLLALTVVFTIVLKMGVTGWVFAYSISKVIELIYLLMADHNYRDVSWKEYDRGYLKEFMKYSLPLMPTTIMWWVMNLSDRYVLAGILGVAATGIYAVAAKIPSILSLFENIFYQAWQTTAIKKAEDEQRDLFFSSVFQNYMTVMVIGVLGLLIISKPAVYLLFAEDYHEAWIYLPPLIIGVMIHALNGNLGSLYAVYKKTNGALISTFMGAVINLTLNFLIIPYVGIMGAALTTLLGYGVTFLYRWFDTKRFIDISIEKRDTLILLSFTIVQLILFYINNYYSYFLRIVLLIVAIIWKRRILIDIVRK